jgi:hypothetical protein
LFEILEFKIGDDATESKFSSDIDTAKSKLIGVVDTTKPVKIKFVYDLAP